MSANARLRLGQTGERLAAAHLTRLGFHILDRNYRTRWGELDIVAFDGRTLAFCEVKSRRPGARHGSPFEAIHPGKRIRVRNMARSWLAERPERPFASAIRFDAIGLTFDGRGRLLALDHREGAF